ncbi:hypothetical protein [Polyangium sp. y55x31]|nr:hypothetical protein [Polyangium sp. y55x31]MDI1481655.1 hypothetical protein [Polyangium sp. y55x31]
MGPSLDALFRLYTFSTGRRLFSLHQVRRLAPETGQVEQAPPVQDEKQTP